MNSALRIFNDCEEAENALILHNLLENPFLFTPERGEVPLRNIPFDRIIFEREIVLAHL